METSARAPWTLNVRAVGTQLVLRAELVGGKIHILLGWKANGAVWLTSASHGQTALAGVPESPGSLFCTGLCKVHSHPPCLLILKLLAPCLCVCAHFQLFNKQLSVLQWSCFHSYKCIFCLGCSLLGMSGAAYFSRWKLSTTASSGLSKILSQKASSLIQNSHFENDSISFQYAPLTVCSAPKCLPFRLRSEICFLLLQKIPGL